MILAFRSAILCFLLILSGELAAQTIDFDRPSRIGEERSARIRQRLTREYTFLLPGAGEPIKTVETMDLVMLAGIKVLEVNDKKLPVKLEIRPEILGGTLNGRRIVPEELIGKTFIGDLSSYPCMFSSADGTPLSKNAETVLAALFRVQSGASYSEILGKPRKFQPKERWTLNADPILRSLAGRELRQEVSPEKIQSLAVFGPEFKVDGIPCTVVDLTFRTMGTHSYDFRTKVKLTLPIKKSDGGMLRLQREGVEVVDRKIISNDPAAAGASVHLVTTEQMEAVYVSPSKPARPAKNQFFQNIFR